MWAAIESDFHREYGVDLSARGFLASHTWRWFVVRLGHLSGESVTRALADKKRKQATGNGAGAMSALAGIAQRKD